MMKSQGELFDYFYDYDAYKLSTNYEFPIIYILGEEDWITPTCLGKKLFNEIQAPYKSLNDIKDAGHATMLDQPEKFSEILLQELKKALNK